ncbi:MAG: alginate export family protein [Candidatus Hydrogenedentes bacterium]|nr:alginate export family protein [Candidatus Hydrogenedentota bacterium]
MLCVVLTHAELQSVEVGGKLEIYGHWYTGLAESAGTSERIPSFFLPLRPIGPYNTASWLQAGDGGNNEGHVEQRTRLHVAAEFTNDVSAFFEINQVDVWGDDFRSDYRTGIDSRATSADDLEVNQAYVSVDNVLGLPARLRIGRQAMEFGSGWLVASDISPAPFLDTTYDAIRLTVAIESLRVDAWISELAESGAAEENGDVDFYGVYATWLPGSGANHESANLEFDVYYLFLRDARSLNDTNFAAPIERLENFVGLDDYGATELHVAGARGAGVWNQFDWEIEAAYQWGVADAVGFLFKPAGQLYGDDDARRNTWGGHAEAGWTTRLPWRIRFFAGGAYYGGEDNRGISFRDWVNPFDRSEASISFNRLFTSWHEDAFIEGTSMSNFWKAYLGANAYPSDNVEMGLNATYYEILEPFDSPVSVSLGGWKVPVAPALSFWTTEGSTELGWQVSLWAVYAYSEDLSFEVGWSHWFTGDAIGEGAAFIDENGLRNVGGRDDEDQEYFYFLTTIEF